VDRINPSPSPPPQGGKGRGRVLVMSILKKAVTVILLREKEPEGFEVFLLKRHEKSSFMGGNYVYPGGKVDRDDGSIEICSFCKGMTFNETQKILGGKISPEESLSHWVAGIRELFEEAGILFAYDQNGNLFQIKNMDEGMELSNYRSLIQKGKMTICQIAKGKNLLFALDQLYYYAHWITPEARPERFDTRFFLARYPSGQEASYDNMETTAEIWITPRKALEENLKGKVILSPPTLKTLEDLARFEAIDDIFKSLIKTEIQPILPILTKISDESFILFPWDPEYEVFQRGEAPNQIDHGRPSYPEDNTTRVVFKDGRWLPYCRIK
jgi:8-oxo-dGTP pyrophosphatase MutT (NUDIX family)